MVYSLNKGEANGKENVNETETGSSLGLIWVLIPLEHQWDLVSSFKIGIIAVSKLAYRDYEPTY